MTVRLPSTTRKGLEERVLRNKTVFESIVSRLNGLSGDSDIFNGVKDALDFQRCHSTGYYSCDAIESALRVIAERHQTALSDNFTKDSVLHVMTAYLPVGGHSRIVERWISRAPESERHSVVIHGQSRNVAAPMALMASASAHGGTVEWIESDSDIDRALCLRRRASCFDRIVLHTNPDDIVPILAFGTKNFRRPVFLFNHADHVFGLGVSIADAFLDIREYGRKLSMQYRGVAAPCILHLPFDDENSQRAKTVSREDIRDELHLPHNGKIIVSAGSTYKYQRFLHWDFVSYMNTVLQMRNDVIFVVAGPSVYTGRKFRDRVRTTGMIKPDMLMRYFKAADLVVDSFPFDGGTSLQDAISVGSAALSLDSVAGKMDYISESVAHVKTIDDLVTATIRVIDDPSYANHVREDLWRRLQDERSGDKWNARLVEIYASVKYHEIQEFVSVPRLPLDETDLFVEYCHIHPKRRNILGVASIISFREDGKKHHAIEFFPRRSSLIGDLK